MSPVQYVARAGALGPETLAIHAVQMDDDDIATLAASGAAVAHCPRSNLRLACGVAPVAEMLAAGITVGLGTDSLASNDSLDMFAEMRAALEMSAAVQAPTAVRGAPAPAGALLPSGVLRMATLEGARALGWDHLVGSLEAGKRADIIAVRLRRDQRRPCRPRWSGRRPPAMCSMTMVDRHSSYSTARRTAGRGRRAVFGRRGRSWGLRD